MFSRLRHLFRQNHPENLSLLEQLPEDILIQVTKHLHPFDYLSFQAVSRSCCSISPLKNLKQLENHTSSSSSSPRLLLPVYRNRTISIVDPRSGRERQFYLALPRQIPNDARIQFSLDGELTLKTSADPYVIWYNPLNKNLVPFKPFYRTHLTLLGMKTFYYGGNNFCIRPLKHNTNHQGLHFICYRGNIQVMRMKESTSLIGGTIRFPCKESCKESYMVSCDGELIVVRVGNAGKWIKVFKLGPGPGTGTWSALELNDLGNKCLCLSKLSSLSCEIPGMKNRIYFARFYGKSMVYYSMETGKLHYSVLRKGCIVEKSLDSFRGADSQYLQYACWFEPRFSCT